MLRVLLMSTCGAGRQLFSLDCTPQLLWINLFAGWVALTATGPLLGSTFIVNSINFIGEDYLFND